MKITSTKTISILLSAFVISACAGNNNSGAKHADADVVEEPTTIQNEPFLQIDHVNGLTIYHITEHISLSTRPIENENIELISSAAFTDSQGRIVGHYYIDGLDQPYGKNPRDKNVTGGFITRPYNGTTCKLWDFYADGYEAELANAAKYGNIISAFAQNIIIYKGVTQDTQWRKNHTFQYRALCELDGELKIIESENPIPYNDFVNALSELHVCNALYLDMGTYNYLWYNLNAGAVEATTEDKIVEVKYANYTKISNFINVYIAD